MKNWLKVILGLLPVDMIIEAVCDWLADMAAKTDNDLDDKAVEIIRVILETAFGKA
ncbi:MAG: hypothetical protein K8R90_05160 [Candidatus Cloacimonetes bacterium]|nr:hypothetical protein [Candidatus Cloacimonadota bacterium]